MNRSPKNNRHIRNLLPVTQRPARYRRMVTNRDFLLRNSLNPGTREILKHWTWNNSQVRRSAMLLNVVIKSQDIINKFKLCTNRNSNNFKNSNCPALKDIVTPKVYSLAKTTRMAKKTIFADFSAMITNRRKVT
jgi:hypothetical protein